MLIVHLGFPAGTWQAKQHEAASVQGYGAVPEGSIADLSDDQALFLLATGCWAPVNESDDPTPRKAQAWRKRAKERERFLALLAPPTPSPVNPPTQENT